jgi:hypothetical protein
MEVTQEIKMIQKQISQINIKLNSYYNLLFDADDPLDMEVLTKQEKQEVIQKIEQLKQEKISLENIIMNDIAKTNPMIKEVIDKINDTESLKSKTLSHDMQLLLYELIYKCPPLLKNEYNIHIIIETIKKEAQSKFNSDIETLMHQISCLSKTILLDSKLEKYLANKDKFQKIYLLFKSDKLTKDKQIRQILDDYIENNISENEDIISYPKIKEIETIIETLPFVSRELLLKSNKKYLKQNIDNAKIINDVFLIYHLYKQNRFFLSYTIYEKIFATLENETNYFQKSDSIIAKLKISILLNVRNKDILSNFQQIKENNDINTTLSIAFLKCPSTHHQDKLLNFININEVRKSIERQGFYYHFLIKNINPNSNIYGSIDSIFDELNENHLKETLIHYFDQDNLEYIYFYDANKLQKTPLTFYKQFLSNIFSGSYLKQCMTEIDSPFINGRIIGSVIEKEDIQTAREVLKFGTTQTPNYNIDEEIIWNELFKLSDSMIEENNELEDKKIKVKNRI